LKEGSNYARKAIAFGGEDNFIFHNRLNSILRLSVFCGGEFGYANDTVYHRANFDSNHYSTNYTYRYSSGSFYESGMLED
jgi:hypothetical protein